MGDLTIKETLRVKIQMKQAKRTGNEKLYATLQKQLVGDSADIMSQLSQENIDEITNTMTGDDDNKTDDSKKKPPKSAKKQAKQKMRDLGKILANLPSDSVGSALDMASSMTTKNASQSTEMKRLLRQSMRTNQTTHTKQQVSKIKQNNKKNKRNKKQTISPPPPPPTPTSSQESIEHDDTPSIIDDVVSGESRPIFK